MVARSVLVIGQGTGLKADYQASRSIPTLVGAVSWGMGCGRPQYVGIYTDIRVYREWIVREMGGEPNHVWRYESGKKQEEEETYENLKMQRM